MSLVWDDAVARIARHLSELEPGPGLRLGLPGGRPPEPSAVLLALLPPATLVYTRRGAQLSSHAGQVSFPGGKPEAGDADLLAAALREAEEEAGLAPSAFEVLGGLSPVPTPTGYLIHPFVARWTGLGAMPRPRAQSEEVAAIVLAPLELLSRPNAHRVQRLDWMGERLLSHEYLLPELNLGEGGLQPATRIWGATGRITNQLLQLARA